MLIMDQQYAIENNWQVVLDGCIVSLILILAAQRY